MNAAAARERYAVFVIASATKKFLSTVGLL
jgi:hypothetical protein